jgi:K+-sensing histidine kinase KdpD
MNVITDLSDRFMPSAGKRLAEPAAPIRYIGSVVLTAVATFLAVAVDDMIHIPNLSLVFVLPVVISAASFGWGPSLLSAVLGSLAYNFFLTDPRFSLQVEDPANIWAIGLLFVVASVVSTVAATARRRADEVSLREEQSVVLELLCQNLLKAKDVTAVASGAKMALDSLFRVPATVLIFQTKSGQLVARAGDQELTDAELDAARSSVAIGRVARGGIYPNDKSRFDFWPAKTSNLDAVVGLAFNPDRRPRAADALVNIVASYVAMAADRVFLPASRSEHEPDTSLS